MQEIFRCDSQAKKVAMSRGTFVLLTAGRTACGEQGPPHGHLFGPGDGVGVPGRGDVPGLEGGDVSEAKEVTRAELEGRLWEILNNPDNGTHGRLESARLLHESIKAREDAQRERGDWRAAP